MIENGDKVEVYMIDADGSEIIIIGTVEHMPVAVGDLLHVTSNYGTSFAINTIAQSFSCIVRKDKNE